MPFYWQPLRDDDGNVNDAIESITERNWVGIVSESDGGIIAYCSEHNAQRIINALTNGE